MNIRKARLCVTCDEVHEQMQCPVCGEKEFLSLHNYIPPMWPDPVREGVIGIETMNQRPETRNHELEVARV